MRHVTGTYKAPQPHWVGDGFFVRSMISLGAQGRHLSPFIMLDFAAAKDYAPTESRRGVGEHPHKGFETVTIVYEGELEHRDSTGAGGTIGPGDVQWMTAGAGILHEEFHSRAFAKSGGRMEMVQLWVNLPAKDKGTKPGYQTLRANDIPSVALPGGAGHVRVIAGELGADAGPARTFTPMNIWDVRLKAGKTTRLSLPDGHTLAVVVLVGTIELNGSEIVRAAEIAMLSRDGGDIVLEANGDAKILVLSGQPIDEPIASYGPFVMNTQAEIEQAIREFQSGKFGAIAESAGVA